MDAGSLRRFVPRFAKVSPEKIIFEQGIFAPPDIQYLRIKDLRLSFHNRIKFSFPIWIIYRGKKCHARRRSQELFLPEKRPSYISFSIMMK